MSVDKLIHPHNHYPNQDTEHFHFPLKFSPTSLQSLCISCTPNLLQESSFLCYFLEFHLELKL